MGADFEEVALDKGLAEADLDALIGKRDYKMFLNAKNELYRERGMKENPPSREEAVRLMAAHPNLVKRPLFVKGAKIVFGYDEAGIKENAK